MFNDLHEYPIRSRRLRWESKVVVRDQDGEARLFLRVLLTGTTFPILDSIPFVRAGELYARLVHISEDGLFVKAYFDAAPETGTLIEFGYDNVPLLLFSSAYEPARVTRLDPARLPEKLRYQDVLLGGSPGDTPEPRAPRDGGSVP